MMVRNYLKFNAFPLVLFCAFLLLTAAVLPADAQIFTAPEPELTGTPAPEGISAVEETPVPAEIYMQKIFVPTNTPADANFTIIIPNNERKDTPDADKTEGSSSDTFRQVKLDLKMMQSFKLTAGKIWNNNPSDNGMLYAVDVNSEKTAIEIETKYDSSIGNVAAAYTNTNSYNTLNGTALKVNSNSPFTANIGDSVSTILTNKNQNFTKYTVKAIEVREVVSTAEVSVFGNAIAKVETPTPEAGQSGDTSAVFTGTIHAAAVDLSASQNGNITADIGGVTARASDAASADVTGVSIADSDNSSGIVTFQSGRPNYYFFTETEMIELPLNGDISASAAVTGNAQVYGSLLTAHHTGSVINFKTGPYGGIYAGATGTGGSVYGLYTDSSGGTINASIGGSVVEGVAFYDDTSEPAVLTGADLGNTAGIRMAGNSGQVNIQVGVVPDEPLVGEKEIKVSSSQVGIYNTSTNGQTKNVVIFGTVTGGTAPILTDSTGGSSFTLAAWAIDQKDGHVAFTKTMAADTEFEKDIRYIILEDPSIAGQVKLEDVSLAKDAQDETYYWANAGKTVTLKSSKEGYHITEAYWRDGMNETDKMACSDGVCTFTVSMGGGVWIHNVKTAKDTEVTITDKDGQEVKTVYYGDTLELKASADPEAQGTWTWSVSDPSTAEVTQDGNVSILSVSASPITITAEYTSAAATGKGSVELTVLPRPVTIKADAKTKIYDNDLATDPNLTATVKNAVPGDTINYSLSREPGQDVGYYSIIVTADAESNPNYEITAVNSTFSITEKSEPSNNRIDFFRIFEETQLPATGFSSLFANTLSEQPMALNYEPVHLRLQIPVIDLTTELVTVPLMNDTWQVEWLGNRAGVLEGSSMPGEGYSFIAAHNTLNSEEYGPFALLSTMEPNDLITVNSEDGTMKLFRVYANELINANDVQKLEKTAEQEAGSLVLITCENESVNGGYLDRRVIFAKPL